MLSLKVKVLGFCKKEKFKEEDDDDKVNKVVLTISIEQNIKKRKRKKCLFKLENDEKFREQGD